MIAATIDKFTQATRILLSLLEANQKWFAAKPEIGGPKFDEAAHKIKFAATDYDTVVKNDFLKANLLEQLSRLHASGFEGFVEETGTTHHERVEATNALIAPYRALLKSLTPILTLHNSLLSQAQMKKIPLKYDEIKENAAKAKQLLSDSNALLDEVFVYAVGKELAA